MIERWLRAAEVCPRMADGLKVFVVSALDLEGAGAIDRFLDACPTSFAQ